MYETKCLFIVLVFNIFACDLKIGFHLFLQDTRNHMQLVLFFSLDYNYVKW